MRGKLYFDNCLEFCNCCTNAYFTKSFQHVSLNNKLETLLNCCFFSSNFVITRLEKYKIGTKLNVNLNQGNKTLAKTEYFPIEISYVFLFLEYLGQNVVILKWKTSVICFVTEYFDNNNLALYSCSHSLHIKGFAEVCQIDALLCSSWAIVGGGGKGKNRNGFYGCFFYGFIPMAPFPQIFYFYDLIVDPKQAHGFH